MPPYTYVCTVAEAVRITSRGQRLFLPPESTCDYIFYDSLYKDGKNNLLGGLDKLDVGAQAFISVASKRNRSQLGLSFALEPPFMRESKDPAFMRLLGAIWNYKIHHFGFLNLYRQYADRDMVTQALNALKVMYRHLKPKATAAAPSYYVIGVSLDDITARNAIVSLMKTVFAPSMFIAISHITYPLRTFSDCRIFPLAMEALPEGLTRGRDYTYGHTILCGKSGWSPVNPLPVMAYNQQHNRAIVYLTEVSIATLAGELWTFLRKTSTPGGHRKSSAQRPQKFRNIALRRHSTTTD
ncbi:hypothetical protein HPB52_016184 [Rhipicephalus sanguineus]|uniref:Uncharacterized protein n=1 Tax=Rhipicephalus sanguineus TaxID=34632 RepID=A0A9D4PFU0_RHISA|nr:hypothetical protein HPB52_016184 [Rhipicephalus sanguineus]